MIPNGQSLTWLMETRHLQVGQRHQLLLRVTDGPSLYLGFIRFLDFFAHAILHWLIQRIQ